jgi:hypothetical protein
MEATSKNLTPSGSLGACKAARPAEIVGRLETNKVVETRKRMTRNELKLIDVPFIIVPEI